MKSFMVSGTARHTLNTPPRQRMVFQADEGSVDDLCNEMFRDREQVFVGVGQFSPEIKPFGRALEKSTGHCHFEGACCDRVTMTMADGTGALAFAGSERANRVVAREHGPRVAGRDGLAAEPLRRGLISMLRRRVPAEDAADLTQMVLCDALAAPAIPSDPDELQRWVKGIARHKVADFHRRGRRLVSEDLVPEPVAEPPPYEARDILGEVLTTSSARDRETLDWIVREHAGERLTDIAAEEGLPSTVVRQRVSRLRRLLRARWAGALLFVLVVFTAKALHLRGTKGLPNIVAEPPFDQAASDLRSVEGTFKIVAVVPASDLPASRRKLLEIEAGAVTVRVSRGHVEVESAAGRTSREVRVVGTTRDGTRVELRSGTGTVEHAIVRGDGTRFVVILLDGSTRGQFTLAKP